MEIWDGGNPPADTRAWQKTPAGLVATVKVFGGEANDKVLAAAQGLLAAARRTGRRAVSMSASIGFYARKVSWAQVDGLRTRILDAIDLKELSLLNPGEEACPGTAVLDAKSLTAAQAPRTTPTAYADALDALDVRGTCLASQRREWERDQQQKAQAEQRAQRLRERVQSGSLGAGFTASHAEIVRRLQQARVNYESAQRLQDFPRMAKELEAMKAAQRWLSAAGIALGGQG